MNVGNLIREARKNAGFTQKQLGEKCGINEANIRKYESGRQNPKIETIQKIAEALEMPISYFFPSIDPTDPEDAKTFGRYIKDGKVELPGLVDGDKMETAILPADFNEFERFIEKNGYRTTLDGSGQYWIEGHEKRAKISVADLENLVRSSRVTVSALIQSFIDQSKDKNSGK